MKPPGRAAGTPAAVGEDKERLAAAFLTARGLRLIARNHRCRYGELDLIMAEGEADGAADGGSLVFVEVRYRADSRFGRPEQTVDPHKQRRLMAAAQHYLQTHPSTLPCRFDVVAIGAGDRIQWFQNAFSAES